MPETVEIIPLIVKRGRKISFSITMGGKHIVHRWTKFQLVYMVFQYYAQCTERERKNVQNQNEQPDVGCVWCAAGPSETENR